MTASRTNVIPIFIFHDYLGQTCMDGLVRWSSIFVTTFSFNQLKPYFAGYLSHDSLIISHLQTGAFEVKASCTGGAYGRLMQAEALPADDLPDCEEQAGDTQWWNTYPAMSKQAAENNGFRSIQEHAERMFETREMFCLFARFGPFCIFDFDMILVGGALEKSA